MLNSIHSFIYSFMQSRSKSYFLEPCFFFFALDQPDSGEVILSETLPIYLIWDKIRLEAQFP